MGSKKEKLHRYREQIGKLPEMGREGGEIGEEGRKVQTSMY